MQRYFSRRILAAGIALVLSCFLYVLVAQIFFANAANIHTYSDLISDSRPNGNSNHTFSFQIKQSIAAGGHLDFDFPMGFVLPATNTLNVRNVELYVNGVPRLASDTQSALSDQVVITAGDGGSIRYNLNTSTGISADSQIEFRVGNHTSTALPAMTTYSSTTGTTTSAADVVPITNPPVKGTKRITMTTGGTAEPMYTNFVVSIIEPITIAGVDTTEEIPPYRFNGLPEGQIGGTTLFIEISLETDEFAFCRYSQTASTTYASMSDTFENTGLVFHTQVVPAVPDAFNTYYVRCMDDEGNINTDDFIISFYVPASPTGTSNTDGDVSGDGTGTGNEGSGTGSGGGGTAGESDGGADTVGGSSGGGGSGGGSGGRSGDDGPDETGGGLESDDGPYPSGDAEVIIRGYAFPGSIVYALVDGFNAESVRASSNGSYSITISEISRGVYTFGIYAIDSAGTKSSTFSTSFTVTGGRTSNLSNIHIMPSIKVTPDPVTPGQSAVISGYSIPNATVTIENQKDGTSASLKTLTTTSSSNGSWSINVDTTGFSAGTYKVRAKAAADGGISTNFSNYTFYGVGQSANRPLNADLNRDGKVNLIDFSILLFWWGSDGGNSNPPADINQDGNVSLTDFSILLFNWTG